MTPRNRKPLTAALALSAVLAVPAVFAQQQQADAQAAPAQSASASAQATTAAAVAAGAQAADQAGASAAKQGWDEVDNDKDGNISKTEAAANAGLAQVFVQADGNADGSLTKDEYKAFVSKNYAQPAEPAQ